MTSRATSILNNSSWLHQRRTEAEPVRHRSIGPPPIASPQASQAYPGAVGGSLSAFLGASQSPAGPHPGTVAHHQSP